VVAVNRTYNATASREGKWWLITVEGVGVTQARSLRDARRAARGLISAMLDLDEDEIAVEVDPVLDQQLAAKVRYARVKVSDLDRQQREAAAASRHAARALIEAGLTGADAAAVLEISPQRVSQILATVGVAPSPRDNGKHGWGKPQAKASR
jgi:hypothetical protein